MEDTISRQGAKDVVDMELDAIDHVPEWVYDRLLTALDKVPSAQPDYAELKREFILMASYIEVLLECSDEQKETLMGFISRLSKHMPWIEGLRGDSDG